VIKKIRVTKVIKEKKRKKRTKKGMVRTRKSKKSNLIKGTNQNNSSHNQDPINSPNNRYRTC